MDKLMPPKEQNETSVMHEDYDSLVAAAERVLGKAVERRPGWIRFSLECALGSVTVQRFRFDGVYGNICRIVASDGKGTVGPLMFAPTAEVISALVTGSKEKVAERVLAVYVKWLKQGAN